MGNPHHNRQPSNREANQKSLAAVKNIIADADKTMQENVRLASKNESYRRTIFLLVQQFGGEAGEVVIDKAVAMLLNGPTGISKRFTVIADDPTRPDSLVYRIVPPPDDLDQALIGQTPQEAAEAAHAAEQLAPKITWASWELEAVLASGARWRTSTHGDRTLGEVEAAMPEGTRVVVAKLTGRTGEIPEFQEQITFSPPPAEPPSAIVTA